MNHTTDFTILKYQIWTKKLTTYLTMLYLQGRDIIGQESTGGNRRLAHWRVKWLIEHSTSHQLLWCIDSFVFRNPPLRQAPNRYQQV